MRKALVVGVNYYEKVNPLYGCVNDAYSIKSVLERNSDGTLNFGVKLMTAIGPDQMISRKELKNAITELFRDSNEIALFYFSGHGYVENSGGYLITSDCSDGDEGFPMSDLLQIANQSPASNKVIILDCCHAGFMGKIQSNDDCSILKEGITILTASSENQYAIESHGSGVFTTLLVDALNGAAANLVGQITPGSIYAHIDQSLGPWDQRPIFKTNIKQFISLRETQPFISIADLKMITSLFLDSNEEYMLDPSYEPDCKKAKEDNMEKFKILQKYNRVNLVVPVGEDHMYYAAMNSKSCKLTVLGVHYWNLVKNDRI